MKLRSYQAELAELSSGSDNVLIQADTGSGKTRILAKIAQQNTHVLCVAHRTFLVKQLSRELAKFDIRHDVLATKHTIRQCVAEHRKLGIADGFLKKGNKHVVSIDSLLSRHRRGLLRLDTGKKWVIIVDEAHHMIDKNKWGKLLKIFPNARIVGATATPCRLDQKSLAYGKGGVFNTLIQASELKQDSVRTLIEYGFLCDFKCYSVPTRIDESALKMGAFDYTLPSLAAETSRFTKAMAGDAIEHYERLASGKQALAFCVNISIAIETAEIFKNAGIASAAIHSKMGAVDVARVFDLFERRVIKVLVNVDMIGEGVDIPAIEALIMLRKTASFGLFRQWCGRSLRPEDDKPFAILIDHADNIREHDLPDEHINWSLENPPGAVKSNLIVCPGCRMLVKAWLEECPECGRDLSRNVDALTPTDIKYIDVNLVEMKKKEINEKIRQEIKERELRENLQILTVQTHSMGALSKTVHKVKLWFAEQLKERVSIYDLNTIFDAESENDFWIDNLTFADVGKNNGKCIKVYTKWQRSQ